MADRRSMGVAGSLAVHAIVAIGLWRTSGDAPAREAAAIDIEISEELPEELIDEEPPEELPPETPPAEVAAPAPREIARPAPPPAPEATTADPTAVPTGPTALRTSVEMNSPATAGPADLPAGRAPPPAPARPPPAPARPVALPAREERPAAAACGELDAKPKPSDRPTDIEYIDDARSRGVEGRLVIEVRVAADGSVADVAVVGPVDAALDAAAVAAVKTWRFEPARRACQPIEGTFRLARRFVLGD